MHIATLPPCSRLASYGMSESLDTTNYFGELKTFLCAGELYPSKDPMCPCYTSECHGGCISSGYSQSRDALFVVFVFWD